MYLANNMAYLSWMEAHRYHAIGWYRSHAPGSRATVALGWASA